MVKTQITVPDELYRKAKEIAKAKEWSLAEVFRRGLEYMARVHEPGSDHNWEVPVMAVGKNAPQTIEALNALIAEESESNLLHKIGQ